MALINENSPTATVRMQLDFLSSREQRLTDRHRAVMTTGLLAAATSLYAHYGPLSLTLGYNNNAP